jgi:hypothetical protein
MQSFVLFFDHLNVFADCMHGIRAAAVLPHRNDLRTRDGRLEELQQRFFAAAAPGRTPQAAEARDAKAADAWFAQLGWGGAGAGKPLHVLEASLLARGPSAHRSGIAEGALAAARFLFPLTKGRAVVLRGFLDDWRMRAVGA